MSDPLREQLEGARSLVILRQCNIDAISRRADAAAAQVVARHKERLEVERQIERDEAELTSLCEEREKVEFQIVQDERAVVVLEHAVADAEQQAPIARAFGKLGYRSQLLQGDPTHTKVLQS